MIPRSTSQQSKGPGIPPAATVTVDPGAPLAAGFTFPSLLSAVSNAVAGHTWANGDDDTIQLVTGVVHYVTQEQVLKVANPSDPLETLTIRPSGEGNALITLKDELQTRVRVFRAQSTGTFKFERLTLIGAAGEDGLLMEYRAAFAIEDDDAGEDVHVEIRNVVITANDGTDHPVLDYFGSFPANNAGTFMRPIYHGDARYRGRVSCLVEDSVFAHFSNAGINGLTAITPGSEVIALKNQATGTADIQLSNIIAFGNDGILRLQPAPDPNSGPSPAGLTTSHIATDNPVSVKQALAVQTALNGAVVATQPP